jgi:hypothetical protein
MERSSQHSEPSNVSAMTPTADRTTPSLPSTRPHLTGESASSSSKNNERSAVVLALFGRSVGPCVGDFSTTYNRVNGRLYAATRAILFYSNLFGFERRLCLNLSDIESIEAYRSTSIRIYMVDCEDHVFRKFFNRDEVLKVLQELYEKETGFLPITDIDATPIRRTNNTELLEIDNNSEENSTRARFESDLSQPDSTDNAAQESSSSLRPRSQSVPSMKALLPVQEKTVKLQLDLTSRTRKFRRSISLRSPNSKVAPTEEVVSQAAIEPPALSGYDDTGSIGAVSAEVSAPTSAPPGFVMGKAWTEAKQPYSEVALKVRKKPVIRWHGSFAAGYSTYISQHCMYRQLRSLVHWKLSWTCSFRITLPSLSLGIKRSLFTTKVFPTPSGRNDRAPTQYYFPPFLIETSVSYTLSTIL